MKTYVINYNANILFENSNLDVMHKMPDSFEANKIYITDDKDFMSRHIDAIYSMFEKSYSDKGGMIVDSKEKLLSSIDLMKIVFSSSNAILACMTYKYFAGGNKIFLGAAIKTDEGKNAIQEIVKSDIEPYDNWFWGEVSGPIEHYFKKHNGRPIPKELVHLFVGTKRNISPSTDPNDLVHYTRKIGNLENPVEKAMYGFKDEAMANAVMESIDNYEEFRLSANAMPDKLDESSLDVVENALDIIIEITEFHEELFFNELLPHWNIQLNAAVEYLMAHVDDIEDPRKLRQVKSAIKQGRLLKDDMPVLMMHQFHMQSK